MSMAFSFMLGFLVPYYYANFSRDCNGKFWSFEHVIWGGCRGNDLNMALDWVGCLVEGEGMEDSVEASLAGVGGQNQEWGVLPNMQDTLTNKIMGSHVVRMLVRM